MLHRKSSTLRVLFQVSNPNVCQLRLDFIKFLLSGPSLQRSPFGHCLDDRMAIFSSQQPSYGLSEGNLICGDMTGQHSKTIVQRAQYFGIVFKVHRTFFLKLESNQRNRDFPKIGSN